MKLNGNTIRRIIPDGLCAQIDLSKIRPLPIFSFIRSCGAISDQEMLQTFNCGVGMVLVVKQDHVNAVLRDVSAYHDCYPIGTIIAGMEKIAFTNTLDWI